MLQALENGTTIKHTHTHLRSRAHTHTHTCRHIDTPNRSNAVCNSAGGGGAAAVWTESYSTETRFSFAHHPNVQTGRTAPPTPQKMKSQNWGAFSQFWLILFKLDCVTSQWKITGEGVGGAARKKGSFKKKNHILRFLCVRLAARGYGRSLTCVFVCQGDECAGDVPAPVKTHHFGLHVPIGCLQTRDNRRYHGNKWCRTQRTHTHTHTQMEKKQPNRWG